jgi:hypothetical protein
MAPSEKESWNKERSMKYIYNWILWRGAEFLQAIFIRLENISYRIEQHLGEFEYGRYQRVQKDKAKEHKRNHHH